MLKGAFTLQKAFVDAGIPADKAAIIISTMEDEILDQVATKQDVAILRSDLRVDMAELRQELKSDMAALKQELKTDIQELKFEMSELRSMVVQQYSLLSSKIDTTMRESEHRNTTRIIMALFLNFAGFMAIAKFFIH